RRRLDEERPVGVETQRMLKGREGAEVVVASVLAPGREAVLPVVVRHVAEELAERLARGPRRVDPRRGPAAEVAVEQEVRAEAGPQIEVSERFEVPRRAEHGRAGAAVE